MTAVGFVLENFTKEELQCKCCGKFSMANKFKISLQALRYLTGQLLVNSGCRCWKHNLAEGGEATSCHLCTSSNGSILEASACDLVPVEVSLDSLYLIAKKSGLFNEVILYRKKNFVHVGQNYRTKDNYFAKKK